MPKFTLKQNELLEFLAFDCNFSSNLDRCMLFKNKYSNYPFMQDAVERTKVNPFIY